MSHLRSALPRAGDCRPQPPMQEMLARESHAAPARPDKTYLAQNILKLWQSGITVDPEGLSLVSIVLGADRLHLKNHVGAVDGIDLHDAAPGHSCIRVCGSPGLCHILPQAG